MIRILMLLLLCTSSFALTGQQRHELDVLFAVSDFITLNHEYRLGVQNVSPRIALSMGIWDCTTRAMAIKEFAELSGIRGVEVKHGYYVDNGREFKHDWAEYRGIVLEGSGSKNNYIEVGDGIWR